MPRTCDDLLYSMAATLAPVTLFDVEAFFRSAGVSRRTARFAPNDTVFVQGEQAKASSTFEPEP
jgi:hypothetical protein